MGHVTSLAGSNAESNSVAYSGTTTVALLRDDARHKSDVNLLQ